VAEVSNDAKDDAPKVLVLVTDVSDDAYDVAPKVLELVARMVASEDALKVLVLVVRDISDDAPRLLVPVVRDVSDDP
jgi:hypothetical protein